MPVIARIDNRLASFKSRVGAMFVRIIGIMAANTQNQPWVYLEQFIDTRLIRFVAPLHTNERARNLPLAANC